jgi:hypothetical protein
VSRRQMELSNEVAAELAGSQDLILRTPASPEEAHLLESRLFYDLSRGRDAKEGIASFLQKRQPELQGTVDEDAPRAYPWWAPVDVKAKAKSKI